MNNVKASSESAEGHEEEGRKFRHSLHSVYANGNKTENKNCFVVLIIHISQLHGFGLALKTRKSSSISLTKTPFTSVCSDTYIFAKLTLCSKGQRLPYGSCKQLYSHDKLPEPIVSVDPRKRHSFLVMPEKRIYLLRWTPHDQLRAYIS